MASESDRLERITTQIQSLLEERLTSILGEIEAVKEIAELIAGSDAEVARRELLKDQLNSRLDGALPDERDDLRRRIANHDEAISNLGLLRTDLTTTLEALADELKAGALR